MRLILGGKGNPTLPSLQEVEELLWQWEVPQTMWECARKRGMPRDLFVPSYHQFVEYHLTRVNSRGEPNLGTIARAKYHGWKWLLAETDYPRKAKPKKEPKLKTKTGRHLKVYTNETVTR
jgi:hypothetical protein